MLCLVLLHTSVDQCLLVLLLLGSQLVLEPDDVSLLAKLLAAQLPQLTCPSEGRLKALQSKPRAVLPRLLCQLLRGLPVLRTLRCLLRGLAVTKLVGGFLRLLCRQPVLRLQLSGCHALPCAKLARLLPSLLRCLVSLCLLRRNLRGLIGCKLPRGFLRLIGRQTVLGLQLRSRQPLTGTKLTGLLRQTLGFHSLLLVGQSCLQPCLCTKLLHA